VTAGNNGNVITLDDSGNLPPHIMSRIIEQVSEKLQQDFASAGSAAPTADPGAPVREASPRPPAPGLSSEDLLSDDMVKTLSQRMLEAGHLDELKNRATSSRRMFRGDPNLSAEEKRDVDEEIMAFKKQTSEVVKDLTTHLISRNEISDMLDFEMVPMSPMHDHIGNSTELGRLQSPALEPRSPGVRSRGPSSLGSAREGGTGSEFGSRLKTVMEQQIQHLTANAVQKTDLEDRIRSLETFINIEFSKAAKEQKELLGQTVNPIKDRTAKLERQINDISTLLNSLEAMVRSQAADSRRLESASHDDAWRPEFDRMNAALEASLKDQRNIAQAVSSHIFLIYFLSHVLNLFIVISAAQRFGAHSGRAR
jgi:hypothetical protein